MSISTRAKNHTRVKGGSRYCRIARPTIEQSIYSCTMYKNEIVSGSKPQKIEYLQRYTCITHMKIQITNTQ